MAATARNPFRPGVGLQPEYLAGRDAAIAQFRRVLAGAPEIPGNARITGLRGVGKTVLLKRLQEVAEEVGFATIATELEPRHCNDSAFETLLARQQAELAKRLSTIERVKRVAADAAQALRRIATVTFEGFEWSLAGDLDPTTHDVASTLLAAVESALAADKAGLVLFFDEAQVLVDDKAASGSHALSSLIAAVSTLQKQNVPISLVLCGLPTLTVNLLTARTYSERMFRGFKVDSLGFEDAAKAFTEPLSAAAAIKADDDLVERVVKDVEGYPYFIQLWGAELWDATHDAGSARMSIGVLEAIEERIHERLDLDFYEPRVESLTPAEQDLLVASAQCPYPPLAVADLNEASSKSNDNVNVLLGRLVKANVLYRPRKGQYLYTAPKFREYLQRRIELD
ncbi:ATP-binding protein [Labedella phragmitis]|uniref:ATP-binding protein n=1 Tax=Labedella phragmitis TaxID=2498849 RepID=A0A444PXU5_9MICO|nr:ATP-binding protein [Labedella phragmitis]RWZ52706.1 ATP-binding protein [Labedella phragmitis]